MKLFQLWDDNQPWALLAYEGEPPTNLDEIIKSEMDKLISEFLENSEHYDDIIEEVIIKLNELGHNVERVYVEDIWL
jgi:hypothetical protein